MRIVNNMNTTQEPLQQKLQLYGEEAKRLLKPLLMIVAVMWFIEIIDRLLFGGSLDRFGVVPRQWSGLAGIIFSPLLHGNFAHLLANSVPFIILGFLITLRHEKQFPAITIVIALVSGFGTWLTAPSNTVHIGASGLIFGYLAYLVVNAWYERSLASIALAVLVIVVYGGLLVGVLPSGGTVSWQGHLFGLVGGIVAAYYFSPRRG